MVLQPFVEPMPLFQFLELLQSIGPLERPLPAHRTAQTQNKRTQTTMPRVGFEPTIPVFERTKTVHAVDRGATVIGSWRSLAENKCTRGKDSELH
jgi:hypothetical protein